MSTTARTPPHARPHARLHAATAKSAKAPTTRMTSPARAARAALRLRTTWLVLGLSALAASGCKREDSQTVQPSAASTRQHDPVPPPQEHGSAAPGRLATPSGMYVVLLGTGTPLPDPRRAGPSLAVIAGEQAFLVDAGPGVVRRAAAAAELGVRALSPTRLTRLLVTHLHSDHTVGMADVMLTPAVVGRAAPLTVLGPPGIEAMLRHLQEAYAVDMQIRREVEGASAGYEIQASTVTEGPVYHDAALDIRAFGVSHGSFDNALGYRFESADRVVVVSGDTAPSDALVAACDGCDLLIHEVYCSAGLQQLDPSVQAYHRSFHTSGGELGALAVRARPKLLVLTHMLPFGCSEAELLAEVRAGFSGEVVLGEDLGVY